MSDMRSFTNNQIAYANRPQLGEKGDVIIILFQFSDDRFLNLMTFYPTTRFYLPNHNPNLNRNRINNPDPDT